MARRPQGKNNRLTARLVILKRDKKPLKGFYELIAEQVAIPADGENAMDRGKRLEVGRN